ncbi:substrate-binding domain-containing protein, partial [Raoultella terrigena]|uniref:substrate-binding domain-containing protein n=1 Tax=Raoultella terrigena TaxID=577 RepID=UPI00132F8A0D
AGERATAQLLAAAPDQRPDALLATNGLLLLGALQAVQAAGLRTPRDIGIAGFDNNDWTALPALDVTTVAQPTYDIGRTAAELLLQRMQEPARPARRVVLEGELVVRGSSAGPRGPS